MKRNLQFTKEDLLKKQEQAQSSDEKLRARDEISSELERMSLLSEDISKRLKAQEMASTAQDLARGQERLMDSLEKLQSGDKNLDSILKQLSELTKSLAALQQAMSQMAQQLPDDFMNMENMRSLGFNEMFSALDEIRKKLMQGDRWWRPCRTRSVRPWLRAWDECMGRCRVPPMSCSRSRASSRKSS